MIKDINQDKNQLLQILNKFVCNVIGDEKKKTAAKYDLLKVGFILIGQIEAQPEYGRKLEIQVVVLELELRDLLKTLTPYGLNWTYFDNRFVLQLEWVK